ncbi:MAG: heavy metal translocating P-type ATPase, partial [Oxalobacteraceae bacterium]
MKTAERVRLELPLVLPDIDDPNDPCVDRLIGLLEGRPGVEHVHMKTLEDARPVLCLHYDPAVITVSRLRELVRAIGARLTEQFAHYIGRTPVPLHARSARLFADRLRRISGVLEAEVSPSGAVRIEYERSTITQKELEERIRSLGAALASDAAPTEKITELNSTSELPTHGGHRHEHGDHAGHDH